MRAAGGDQAPHPDGTMKRNKPARAQSKTHRRTARSAADRGPTRQQSRAAQPKSPKSAGATDGTDRLAPVKAQFVNMLTSARLLKTINDATCKVVQRIEAEIAAKQANDAEFRALRGRLTTDAAVQKALGGLTDEEALQYLVGLASNRPDVAKLLAVCAPAMTEGYEPLRVLGKLIGSTILSALTVNLSDAPSLDGFVARFAAAAQDALNKWWAGCEVTWPSGVFKVRHPLARHDVYNQEGISLLCILNEITYALEQGKSWPAYVSAIAYWHNVKTHNWNDDSSLLLRPLHRLCGLQCVIEEPGDLKRVAFIRDYPSALLFSPEHQDAVARWLYAARCGSNTDRKLAQEYIRLTLASRRTPGRRKLHHVDARQMRQAHADLSTYIDRLNDAIQKARTPNDVRRTFPDCDFLYLDPTISKYTDRISDLVRLKDRIKKPQPGAEAVAFIARHTGMKKTLIYELLSVAIP